MANHQNRRRRRSTGWNAPAEIHIWRDLPMERHSATIRRKNGGFVVNDCWVFSSRSDAFRWVQHLLSDREVQP